MNRNKLFLNSSLQKSSGIPPSLRYGKRISGIPLASDPRAGNAKMKKERIAKSNLGFNDKLWEIPSRHRRLRSSLESTSGPSDNLAQPNIVSPDRIMFHRLQSQRRSSSATFLKAIHWAFVPSSSSGESRKSENIFSFFGIICMSFESARRFILDL
jgi:hypothetical protein